MEQGLYETGELTPSQLILFTKFLDDVIGTEYECNENYIMIFDLNYDEILAIRRFENDMG